MPRDISLYHPAFESHGENPFHPLVHSRTLFPVREVDGPRSLVGRPTGEKFKKSKLKAWEVSSNNKQINKTTILRSGIAQTSTGPAVVTQLYQHLHTGFLASGQSSIPYPASFCRHTHVCHTGHKSAFPQTQWGHSGRDLIIFILVGL